MITVMVTRHVFDFPYEIDDDDFPPPPDGPVMVYRPALYGADWE